MFLLYVCILKYPQLTEKTKGIDVKDSTEVNIERPQINNVDEGISIKKSKKVSLP